MKPMTMTADEEAWLRSRCDCATSLRGDDYPWQKLLRQARAEIDAVRAALRAAEGKESILRTAFTATESEAERWYGEVERQREIVAGREEAIHAHAGWDASAVCAARSDDDVQCMWPASEVGDDGEPLCRDCAAERVSP